MKRSENTMKTMGPTKNHNKAVETKSKRTKIKSNKKLGPPKRRTGPPKRGASEKGSHMNGT